jgi:hypothetical protein
MKDGPLQSSSRGSLTLLGLMSLLAWGATIGCSSPKKPPPKVAEEAPDESWVTDAGAKKKKKPEPATAQEEDGPDLLMSRDSLIETSVDEGGARLTLGSKARLTLPRGSVSGSMVHFAIAGSNRQGPALLGKIYETAPALSSQGDPFVLELPMPRGRKSANFAISRISKKNGGEQLVWDVKAATSIDSEKGMAVLELSELPEGWVHLTAKRPD